MIDTIIQRRRKFESRLPEPSESSLPSIKYNRRKKVNEEDILAKDENSRTFSSCREQDQSSGGKPLHREHTKKSRTSHLGEKITSLRVITIIIRWTRAQRWKEQNRTIRRAVMDSFIQRVSSSRWPITIHALRRVTNTVMATTEAWSDVVPNANSAGAKPALRAMDAACSPPLFLCSKQSWQTRKKPSQKKRGQPAPPPRQPELKFQRNFQVSEEHARRWKRESPRKLEFARPDPPRTSSLRTTEHHAAAEMEKPRPQEEDAASPPASREWEISRAPPTNRT